MRRLRAIVLALLLAAPALLGAERGPGLGDVTEVRHWSYPDYTRVVIELDRPIEIKHAPRRLPADRKADRPERLYLDLEGVWVGRRYKEGIVVRDGLLEGVRIGQNTRSAIRVVVDLESYADHRLITLSHPDRLVLDVYGPRRGAVRRRRAPAGPDARA